MKLPFQSTAPARALRLPQPTAIPKLEQSSIAATYRAARVGGDFFDFVVADSRRLVFLLMDIAGRREEAFDIAASVQELFRSRAAELFHDDDINENEALTVLLIELNREIMRAAGGVRCAPTFLGCYDERYGTLVYISAGHPPALLKDGDGVTVLEATGLPLGLFSHATHDPQVSMLEPGAALLLASKGVVESRAGSKEYGLDRLKEFFAGTQFQSAQELCNLVLDSVTAFAEQGLWHRSSRNDTTTLAIVRAAAQQAASAG